MDASRPRASSSSADRSATRPRALLVIDAESEEEIRETLGRDPWSGSHLVIESIDPWTIRLGALPA